MASTALVSVYRALASSLRLVSRIILFIAVFLMIKNIIDAIPVFNEITRLDELATLLEHVLVLPIGLIFLSIILGVSAGLLDKYAERAMRSLEQQLLGLIESYRVAKIHEIAAKMKMPPEEVEKLLFQLKHEGKFHGTISRDGTVYMPGAAETPAPMVVQQAAAPPPAGIGGVGDVEAGQPPEFPEEERYETTVRPAQEQPPPAASPTTPPATAESRELEEKKRRLEELYRKGLISRETYMRMLRELESGGG